MATKNKAILQPGFPAGEISPRMAARVDLAMRKAGAERIENFLITQSGDITKRPGTIHSHASRSSNQGRLVPFIYDDGDSYILEFTALAIRFHQTGAVVRDSHTVTGSSWAAGTATIIVASHHAVVGDVVVVTGMNPTGYNGTFIVTSVTAVNILYALTADPGAFVSGGAVTDPYTVTTTYTLADLAFIQFEQIGNTIYIAGGKEHVARRLVRTTGTNWTLSNALWFWGPFDLRNDDEGNKVTLGATSGNNVSLTTDKDAFASDDVGRHFAMATGATQTWGFGVIDLFTNPTTARMDFVKDAQTVGPTKDWKKAVFNHTNGSNGDNPRILAIFQGRLWWGHSNSLPHVMWGSMSGRFNDFLEHSIAEVIRAVNAVTIGLASNSQIRLRWAHAGPRAMFVGTDTNVIAISGPQGESIEPGRFESKVASQVGVAKEILPASAETELFYVQRGKRKIRRLSFDARGEDYPSQDLMVWADHLRASTFEELVYLDEPFPLLWCRRANGTMIALTMNMESDRDSNVPFVEGWSQHTIGGSFGTGDAVVEAIATIPGTNRDELWMIVKRTINGATVRYVEYMAEPFEDYHDREDTFFLDSALEYEGVSTTSITGLEHLEGETVTISSEGSPVPSKTVASGAITLDEATTHAIVGFPIESNLLTYRTADDDLEDNQLNQSGRIHRITVEMFSAVGLRYWWEEVTPSATMDEAIFRKEEHDPEAPIPLFSGPLELILDGPWSRDARVYLRHDYPLPCSILGLTTHWSIEDEKESV